MARVASGARGGARGPAVFARVRGADGQWLAVVTTSSGRSGRREAGVHVYNLDALKLHASLPPPPGHRAWPPVAATAPTPGGVLALHATTPSSPTTPAAPRWLLVRRARDGRGATNALASMPGQICALSFDPTPGSSVLLAQTPAAIARLDLAAGGPGGGGVGVSQRSEARRPGARREAEQTQAQERRGRVS